VGGDISVTGRAFPSSSIREIVAPSGRLDLIAVGSPGRVVLPQSPDEAPRLEGFTAPGDVSFDGGWASTRGAARGGRIFLRGGDIVLEKAAVESDSHSPGDAGSVDVEADSLRVVDSLVGAFATNLSTGNGGTIRIRAGDVSVEAVDAGSRIEATTAGPGRGGTIHIEADRVSLDGASASAPAIVNASSFGSGDAGSIAVRAAEVHLTDEARLSAANFGGEGRAGDIAVAAEELVLREGSVLDVGSFGREGAGTIDVRAARVELSRSFMIAHSPAGSGPAGHIGIDARELSLTGASEVTANSFGPGAADAGSIRVRADQVELTDGSRLAAANFNGEGRAGSVVVDAEGLVLHGSQLDAGSFGRGGAGTIEVHAARMELERSFLFAHAAAGSGPGGSIGIDAGDLSLADRSELTVNVFGTGDAGSIHVRAGRVRISDESRLAAANFGGEGRAGDIVVEAGELVLRDGSTLDAGSFGRAGAGTIEVQADRVELSESFLIAHTPGGSGAAGRIEVDAQELSLAEGSEITVNSFGTGDAGRIGVEAGEIEIVGSLVSASSFRGSDAGDVELSADRIRIVEGGEVRARTAGEGHAGSITLRATESIELAGDDTDVQATARGSGDAGRIEISAPDVALDDDALVAASALGFGGSGGEIRIAADRLAIQGGALVSTSALGGGTGSIAIEAGQSVRISNAGGDPLSLQRLLQDDVPGPSGVFAASLFGAGERGAVTIAAPLVQIADGGIVATTTLGPSDAGAIEIRADRVEVLDGGLVDSSSAGAGAAGAVDIRATSSIRVAGSGADGVPSRVRSAATAGGGGGDVYLGAPEVVLEGGALATTTVGAAASGRGGTIEVEADRLRLAAGGRIDSGTFSTGDGGVVRLGAGELLEIEGAGSGVFAETGGPGGGGDLEIEASRLRIADGGVVSTRSGSGVAGAAPVFQDAVAGGFVPELRTPPDATPGTAGDVRIAAIRLELEGGSIDSEALQGAGGNVTVQVADRTQLERGAISASVGSGSGGNVLIEAPLLVLESSRIVAQADEGSGGSVGVRADLLLASTDSTISASARLGIDGTVSIDAPDLDLSGSLAALPEAPLDASGLSSERCASRTRAAASSFVVRGREGVPASHAEGLLLALVPPSRGPEAGAAPFPEPALALAASGVSRPGCLTASR
jgi:large exoprotein involved in heme utilization and adhesion